MMNKVTLWGIGTGYFGWVAALAVVFLISSDHGAWMAVILPAVALTLGLFVSTVVPIALMQRSGLRRGLVPFLIGRVWLDIGVMLFVALHQVLPRFANDATQLRALEVTQSSTGIPAWLPWPCIGISALLLTASGIQILSGDAHQDTA